MPVTSNSGNVRGFTLVELSIVIVIIGMIIGAIMVGHNLVERSRITGLAQQIATYQSVFTQFTDKYQQLPGDMVDAYTYFDPSASGNICGSSAVVTSSAAGCNGNGDGLIDGSVTNAWRESLRGWQHLAAAGFVQGSFTGVTSTNRYDPGINIPLTTLENASGYRMYYATSVYSLAGHFLMLGTVSSSTALGGPAIKVSDALAIDQKIDDGLAASGKLFAEDASGANSCVNGSNIFIVDDATNTGVDQCKLEILLQKFSY